MSIPRISKALEHIDDDLVSGAAVYERTKKKNGWIKWAAMAACLCIVVGVAIPILLSRGSASGPVSPGGIPGESYDVPGTFPDNIDPIIASIAVYPATEDIQNVKDATLDSIDRETAYSFEALGSYLPAVLPEGYQFKKANLYETTMTDGTKYYLLRVTYSDGSGDTVESPIDEGQGAKVPDPSTAENTFAVWIMNYKPDTKKKIYSGDALIKYVKKLPSASVFHFSYDGLYFGFSPISLTSDEVLTVINSMISH